MSEILKICKIHGELTIEQVRKDGEKYRCKACRMESNKKTYYKNREKRVSSSMRWKRNNKGDYNEWCRQDRIKNPEKYKKYEENRIKKHGIEKLRKYEVSRIHGLKIDEYERLIELHNNKCAICNKVETRKGRSGDTAPLCIDHCHNCESRGNYNVRGLLCHACNIALGKFKDDITLLKQAIIYLEKHTCIE